MRCRLQPGTVAEIAFHDIILFHRQALRGHGGAKALQPPRAGTVLRIALDEGDAAVAEVDQMPRHLARGLAVVDRDHHHAMALIRSEERRVGKECVSTCRSRWSPYH